MEKNEDSCGAVEGAAAGRRRSSMKTGKRPEGFRYNVRCMQRRTPLGDTSNKGNKPIPHVRHD